MASIDMPRLMAWVAMGVPQLVGMDVAQPCRGSGRVDEPGDSVPVQGSAVLVWDQEWVSVRDVRGAVGVDELHGARVER